MLNWRPTDQPQNPPRSGLGVGKENTQTRGKFMDMEVSEGAPILRCQGKEAKAAGTGDKTRGGEEKV